MPNRLWNPPKKRLKSVQLYGTTTPISPKEDADWIHRKIFEAATAAITPLTTHSTRLAFAVLWTWIEAKTETVGYGPLIH
ncbi:hypothetical protein ACFLV7_08660 [Chloroflexota bacterium]